MDYFDIARETVAKYGGGLSENDREGLVADIASMLWEKEMARPGESEGFYYKVGRDFAIDRMRKRVRDRVHEESAGGMKELDAMGGRVIG